MDMLELVQQRDVEMLSNGKWDCFVWRTGSGQCYLCVSVMVNCKEDTNSCCSVVSCDAEKQWAQIKMQKKKNLNRRKKF